MKDVQASCGSGHAGDRWSEAEINPRIVEYQWKLREDSAGRSEPKQRDVTDI